MTGIRFVDNRPPTLHEKEMMQADLGLAYKPEVKAWLKRSTSESRERTQALARWLANERRTTQNAEQESDDRGNESEPSNTA